MNSAAVSRAVDMKLRTLGRNGIHWIVEDCYARLIPDELVKVLLAPRSSDHIIRENKVRRSMLIALPGRQACIFAKLYKPPTGSERFKYFFLSSKASSEWKHMLSLYAKGLPVARPLARGEKRRLGFLRESFLFTEELKQAQVLNAIPEQQFSLISKRALVEKAAQLVSALHNQGFFFRDLHAGNMLFIPEEDGGFQLCLVDFHKAWHTRWVPRWMRIRDLAQLRNSVSLSAAQQWRFLKLYGERSRIPPAALAGFAGRIEVLARKMRVVHLRSRTKRCLKESSEFSIHRGRQHTIYRQKIYPQGLIDTLAGSFGDHPSCRNPLILKKTPKESVTAMTAHYGGTDYRLVIKESSFSSLGSRIRYSLFHSRAKRSWIAARALRVRGIATADTLALVEYRSRGMLARTLLLMQYLHQARELNDYVLGRYNKSLSPAEEQQKKKFIAALAAQVRAMHEKGVYHADLKSNNVLVREDAGGWTFYIIDLDRIRFKEHLSFKERANNLAQINASIADCITPAERLLFFKLYAQGTPLIKQGKKYFQSIMEIGRAKNTRPYAMTFPETKKPLR